MAKSTFINEIFLKENTAISGNVPVEELVPFIKESQDSYIQDILGSALYNELDEAVFNIGTTPLTDDQKSLLNVIRPALAYWTMYVALPFQLIKWKGKGLQKNANPETGSSAPDLSELKFLQEKVMDRATYYSDRVSKYLCNNSELYPSYLNQGSDPDVYPQSNEWGFYVPGIGNDPSQSEMDILRKYLR